MVLHTSLRRREKQENGNILQDKNTFSKKKYKQAEKAPFRYYFPNQCIYIK